MFRADEANCNLQEEILVLKRKLGLMENENQRLKVRIRKLEKEIYQKDKHIIAILNPNVSVNFRKFVSEQGATLVLHLREENLKLEKELDLKNALIKRLQNGLQTAKLYALKQEERKRHPLPDLKKCPTTTNFDVESTAETQEIRLTIPYYDSEEIASTICENSVEKEKEPPGFNSVSIYHRSSRYNANVRSRSLSPVLEYKQKNKKSLRMKPTTAIGKEQTLADYEKLKQNLQKIKDISTYYRRAESSAGGDKSGESFTSFLDNFGDSQSSTDRKTDDSSSDNPPHEEIQLLHKHFEEMLSEVVELKKVIFDLKSQEVIRSRSAQIRQPKKIEEPTKLKRAVSKKVDLRANKKNTVKTIKTSKSESDKDNVSSKPLAIAKKPGKTKPNVQVGHTKNNVKEVFLPCKDVANDLGEDDKIFNILIKFERNDDGQTPKFQKCGDVILQLEDIESETSI